MRVRHRRNIRNRRFARRILAVGYAPVILPPADFGTKLSVYVKSSKSAKPSSAPVERNLN